jgi:hypothetical protein
MNGRRSFHGKRRLLAGVSISTLAATSPACYAFSEADEPISPVLSLAERRVQLPQEIPDGCTPLGEVSATGSAVDDPSGAADRARDNLRIRAAAMGANYVALDMQAGGPT